MTAWRGLAALEHRRAGDQDVGAGLRDDRGGLRGNAAVDLDVDGARWIAQKFSLKDPRGKVSR